MKKQTRPKLTFVPTSGPQAFAAMQAEIAAVPDSELVSISVDIPYAHQIVFAAADRIDTLMADLEGLPVFDMGCVRKVRLYAAACQHAHLLATSPEAADPRLPALLKEAAGLRADLLATAELLAHFGEVSAERVAAIRRGTAHIDTANAIEQLGVLFAELSDEVKARIPVSTEMVDRAPQLAHQLHVLLGVKRLGGSMAVGDPQRTRQQAYTLLVRAYDECRRGVAFLRAHYGDADQIAPSIYVKQRRRAGSAAARTEEVIEPSPVPESTNPVAETPSRGADEGAPIGPAE